jgi:hypothetical protein
MTVAEPISDDGAWMVALLESDHREQVAPNQHKEEIVTPPAKKAAPAARRAAATVKAGRAKTTVQATITLKHLAAALADSHDLPKKQAEAVLGDARHPAPQEG